MPVIEVLADFERPDAARLLHLRDALAFAVQELRPAPPIRDAHGAERDQNDRGCNEKVGVWYGREHVVRSIGPRRRVIPVALRN